MKTETTKRHTTMEQCGKYTNKKPNELFSDCSSTLDLMNEPETELLAAAEATELTHLLGQVSSPAVLLCLGFWENVQKQQRN